MKLRAHMIRMQDLSLRNNLHNNVRDVLLKGLGSADCQLRKEREDSQQKSVLLTVFST